MTAPSREAIIRSEIKACSLIAIRNRVIAQNLEAIADMTGAQVHRDIEQLASIYAFDMAQRLIRVEVPA